MVSLIGHAHDARTPASTAWLLAGAVALGLVALTVTDRALVDAERLVGVYPSAWPGHGRRGRRRPHCRLGSSCAVAARAAARCDSLNALAVRCESGFCAPAPGAKNGHLPPTSTDKVPRPDRP
jgi:hypothetical protein